jgi:hypothetical protein
MLIRIPVCDTALTKIRILRHISYESMEICQRGLVSAKRNVVKSDEAGRKSHSLRALCGRMGHSCEKSEWMQRLLEPSALYCFAQAVDCRGRERCSFGMRCVWVKSVLLTQCTRIVV